jgi:hypothetical protein
LNTTPTEPKTLRSRPSSQAGQSVSASSVKAWTASCGSSQEVHTYW